MCWHTSECGVQTQMLLHSEHRPKRIELRTHSHVLTNLLEIRGDRQPVHQGVPPRWLQRTRHARESGGLAGTVVPKKCADLAAHECCIQIVHGAYAVAESFAKILNMDSCMLSAIFGNRFHTLFRASRSVIVAINTLKRVGIHRIKTSGKIAADCTCRAKPKALGEDEERVLGLTVLRRPHIVKVPSKHEEDECFYNDDRHKASTSECALLHDIAGHVRPLQSTIGCLKPCEQLAPLVQRAAWSNGSPEPRIVPGLIHGCDGDARCDADKVDEPASNRRKPGIVKEGGNNVAEANNVSRPQKEEDQVNRWVSELEEVDADERY